MARIFKPITNEAKPCCSGSRVKIVYEFIDGKLVKSGELDLYDYINSFRDECLIDNIIRRINNGDVRALNVVQGVYIDSTQIPNNIHDAHRSVLNAEKFYKNLGEDIRKDYPDFNTFINEIGSVDGVNRFISRVSAVNKGNDQSIQGGSVNE